MGSCLCIKPEVKNEVIINQNNKSKRYSMILPKNSFKLIEEYDSDITIQKTSARVPRKKSNNKLSCDEYWDEIRKNTKYQTLLVKNDLDKIMETKKESHEPRVKTFQTNTNYSINIIEVDDKISNPNEVFYVRNKDINCSRPTSPKQNLNKETNFKTKKNNLDLDRKITEGIKSNVDFDKLYDDILSKHLYKK